MMKSLSTASLVLASRFVFDEEAISPFQRPREEKRTLDPLTGKSRP